MNVRRNKALIAGAVVALIIGVFFYVLHEKVGDHSRAVHIAKVAVGLTAAGYFFYEQRRKELFLPISVRWKKFIAISLGVISILLYFNAFKLGYYKWYHRHDQFHYYIGAKYFDELRYERIYKCAAIAQDELGTIEFEVDGRTRRLDLRREVRKTDRKLRDLGNTNLLIPAKEILDHPEICLKNADGSDRWAPDRWEAFKEDIKFFRIEAGDGYWEGMQKDHGYNPPPVWSLAGYAFAALAPASVNMQIFLGAIDILYNILMFVVIYWAFGWRVFSVAAIFWGCEGAADPYYWTGGAYLRQDWLFWSVMAAAMAHKRHFKLAGASMVYAGLLRIFPGLMVIGWLVVAGAYIWRHKKMARDHLQTLIGGTLAAAILIAASVGLVGYKAYPEFFHHTIDVHDRTPLTNHMGFRVVVAHNLGALGVEAYDEVLNKAFKVPPPGRDLKATGRMKYTRDNSLNDPFQIWKDMRNERYDKYKVVAWVLRLILLVGFIYVLKDIKLLWVAQGLSVIWVIMLSQLTNYYYGFFICAAPLILLRRNVELALYGYVVLSQVVFLNIHWNDDKYTLQTLLGMILGVALLCMFARKPGSKPTAPAASATAGAPIKKTAKSHR
jgi:hypothetical protein